MSKRPVAPGARFPLSACLTGACAAMCGAGLMLGVVAARLAPGRTLALLAQADVGVRWQIAAFVLTFGALGFILALTLPREAD